MQILFVHQNFPAQFGHIAHHLAKSRGWRCDFVTEPTSASLDGVRTIPYEISGGSRETTHYFSRTFENAVWHAHAVYQACGSVPDLDPDLIVGHSGFGSTLYLPERFPGVPVVNYFEHFYHPHGSDLDFRPDFPAEPRDSLRARTRNAMILLDLHNCRSGYSPTHYQKGLFPTEYQAKIDVIFDGIETKVFHRRANVPRRVGSLDIPESTRIVTYVSRGFESMRGFDIFMRAARLIYREHPDVLFVVVGSDRICYGGDEKHIRHRTFKEHVLAQDDYDMSKFVFAGLVSTDTLVDLLSVSDLHIYLTVPFVLSWSVMNALACGCVVLASDTEPVREVLVDGETGLLAGFFDVEGFARRALDVLRDPTAFREVGDRAAAMVESQYSLDVTLPLLVGLFERATSGG
jgi:glycosyltransferase involved in cell wall biosynthesis